jgi:hypothetical protein
MSYNYSPAAIWCSQVPPTGEVATATGAEEYISVARLISAPNTARNIVVVEQCSHIKYINGNAPNTWLSANAVSRLIGLCAETRDHKTASGTIMVQLHAHVSEVSRGALKRSCCIAGNTVNIA